METQEEVLVPVFQERDDETCVPVGMRPIQEPERIRCEPNCHKWEPWRPLKPGWKVANCTRCNASFVLRTGKPGEWVTPSGELRKWEFPLRLWPKTEIDLKEMGKLFRHPGYLVKVCSEDDAIL